MDLGSEVWLVILLVLPLLAIIVALLPKQRAKLSKNVRLTVGIIVIALFVVYTIWNLFFR